MNAIFARYQNAILITILVVLASLLVANNVKGKDSPNHLERFALLIASPIENGVTSSINGVLSAWNRYIDLVHTSDENERLKKTISKEKFKNGLLIEKLKRYERIESLLSFHPVVASKFKVADLVAWDSTNLSRTIVIDKGSGDGIGKNMIAYTNQGLVGRIVTLASNSSRVLMITDSRSAVDAFVQEGRARCLIVGQNKGKCIVKYLSIGSKVKVGDRIVSSGLGRIFPKGIMIGTISSLKPDSGRLFYQAELIPSANLKRVEEVLIMTERRVKSLGAEE